MTTQNIADRTLDFVITELRTLERELPETDEIAYRKLVLAAKALQTAADGIADLAGDLEPADHISYRGKIISKYELECALDCAIDGIDPGDDFGTGYAKKLVEELFKILSNDGID